MYFYLQRNNDRRLPQAGKRFEVRVKFRVEKWQKKIISPSGECKVLTLDVKNKEPNGEQMMA
jgi:hypothetical protein